MQLEVWRLIAHHVELSPLKWLDLSLVCRGFYYIFTSDEVWKFCNPYGFASNIYYSTCDHFESHPHQQKELISSSWKGDPVPHSDDLYVVLGQMVHLQLDESFKTNNQQLVWCAIHFQGCSIKYASSQIADSYPIAKAAVAQNGMALEFVSNNLAKNAELVKLAISNNSDSICFADYNLVATDLSLSLLLMRYDSDLVEYTAFTDNLEYMLEAVKFDGRLLRFASPRLKDHSLMVELAVKNNPLALQYSSPRYKYEKQLLLECIERNSTILGGVDHEHPVCENGRLARPVKDDRDLMLAAIKQSGIYIQMVSERLSGDKELVRLALQTYPRAHEWATVNIQREPEQHSHCTLA